MQVRSSHEALCGCYACVSERVELEEAEGALFQVNEHPLARMFLCEKCGAKRCPHAADHRNICTASNAPGQRGSLYE